MIDNTLYIVKILGISLILSFLVKYGGQWLNPDPTVAAAIAGVIVPSVVLGLVLAWRGRAKAEG